MSYNQGTREAFGLRLREARREAGMNLVDVAAVVDASQQAVSAWEKGTRIPEDPQTVFALEEAVKVAPGTLSRILGYLPLDAESVPSAIVDSIISDGRLDTGMKRALIDIYRKLVE